MKLLSIPKNKYDAYRLDVIFKGYKWDPQFVDNNTIARHALVLTKEEAAEVCFLTQRLSDETIKAENIINSNLSLAHALALPRRLRKALYKMSDYRAEKNIRLMRFDFHPVAAGGWAVSEVNSDVPGGFAEASIMPGLAAELFPDYKLSYINFGENLVKALAAKVKKGDRIALVHCTSYSDDRQIMQFLGDRLQGLGFTPVYMAGDHVRFRDKRAISVLDGRTGALDAIFRFTPLEWLAGLPKAWRGYFDTITPSCNHPVAIFAQTKRFPLIWDDLEKTGVDLTAWRELLPQTLEVKDAKNKDGFIFKPACGRVGEGIAIKSAISKQEYDKILKDVKKHPRRYVAQKLFESLPLTTDESESFHVCLGSYSVEGQAAGFYARISKTARIDSYAQDIPVLIES